MLNWTVRKLTGQDKRGRNPVVNNFKVEGWKDTYIFVRELLQNILDNRLTPKTCAKVDIKILNLESEEALNQYKTILVDLEQHLVSAEKNYTGDIFRAPKLLVIKEEGTTGFSGDYKDSGANSDWANFFFGAAKEAKSGSKNGRAGQGKISYYMLSKARSLFVVTKRSTDKKLLMMGNANFSETHSIDNQDYDYSGYFSNLKNGQPLPIEDEAHIKQFCLNFGVDIDTMESGNVYFIPSPSDELDNETSIAIEVTTQDFFYPVLQGRLELTTKNQIINKENLTSIHQLYKDKFHNTSKSAPSLDFLKFIENTLNLPLENTEGDSYWKGRDIGFDNLFTEKQLKSLRDRFNQENIIAVEIPVLVSRKQGKPEVQNIKVYLQRSDKIEVTEEAYIRTDLFIANEVKLKSVTPHNAYGLVLADSDNEPLAEFLADAEVASHLSWNSRASKVEENFVNIDETLRKVRGSLPKLFNLLLDNEDCDDSTFMVGFLSIPKEDTKPINKKKNKKKDLDGPSNPKPLAPIKSAAPVIELVDHNDGDGFKLLPTQELSNEQLPIVVDLEIVYDLLQSEGDPFKHHSHLDYDFSLLKEFNIVSEGCEIITSDLQHIRVLISSSEFSFSFKGFNKNIPLKMRYNLPKHNILEDE